MIATYQFSCDWCRAHARVDVTAHDDHVIDLEKLAAAVGFLRPPDTLELVQPYWRCASHFKP